MTEYDFKEKLDQSNTNQIKKTIEIILNKQFGNNIKIDWTDKDMKAQLIYGNDVVVVQPDGVKTTIDYKVCDNNYVGGCFIETCSQHRNNVCDKKGWFFTNPSKYVLFVYRTKHDYNSIMESNYFFLPLDNKALQKYVLEEIKTRREYSIKQKNANYVTKGFVFSTQELQNVVEKSNLSGFQSSLNLFGVF